MVSCFFPSSVSPACLTGLPSTRRVLPSLVKHHHTVLNLERGTLRRELVWIILLLALISACTSPALLPKPKQEVTEASYSTDKTKGLVVLSAIWGRALKCSQFASAQLRGFGFDRMPIQTGADDAVPEVMIEGSPYYKQPEPINYLLAVDPGEYALTQYMIEVASSTFNVKVGTAGRSTLVQDGKAIGGTFTVKAGELVYIGHFGLDCGKEPSIWRYYPEGHEAFEHYRKAIKRRHYFLDVENMQFRLFKTSLFGKDYALPR